LRLRPRYNPLQVLHGRLANFRNGSEVGEQLLSRFQSDAFNLGKLGSQCPAAAALPMEIDGKAMALIPDLLDQPEDGWAAIEHDRIVFASRHVDDFFLFCDAGQRLIDNIQIIESRLGSV